MRIIVETTTGRIFYDEVEMIIIDEKELCVWQPQIGTKKGSRRTRIERKNIKGIVNVDTNETKHGKVEMQGTKD